MEERKIYTLSQVGTAIKKRIEEATHGQAFWIKAEIASIRITKHAYLELVEHQGEELERWLRDQERERDERGR